MYLYTALGDSITAGEGASTPGLAFPSLIVRRLRQQGRTTFGEILAYPGWTSEDLDAAVFEHSPVYLTGASAITIWIGGDNLAYAGLAMLDGAPRSRLLKALAGYKRDIQVLVAGLKKISRGKIILCTQYNPFPNSSIAVTAIQELNQLTESLSARYNTSLAPVHTWFAGRQQELIAGYQTGRLNDLKHSPILPIHPNNRGHRAIADGLMPYLS